MLDATLFHGIAVIIDDEIEDAQSSIYAIKTQIKQGGCSVLGMADIPDAVYLSSFTSISFFVIDWLLVSIPLGDGLGAGADAIPPGLKRDNARRVIEFLKNIKRIRFAPVFIFTAGPVAEVIDALRKHPDLYTDESPSNIFVKTKDEVRAAGVFDVLVDSLRQAPSAYVLKMWERQYEQAKNQLFLDFYSKSLLWPLILWKTFEDDGLPPSVELGNLIGRNLLSRMTPFKFDLSSADNVLLETLESDPEYKKTLLKVLEGERFLSSDQLHPESIAPGDVFKIKNGKKHYYVNIRPDCDCIARDGADQETIQLYLLQGDKLSSGQFNIDPQYGEIQELDTQTIIFPMDGGIGVSFKFKNLHVKQWGEIKEKRIGRLLPPFLTRLQQRYSGYLQRPGLTRIPKAAIPLAVDVAGGAEVDDHAQPPAAVLQEHLHSTGSPKMQSMGDPARRRISGILKRLTAWLDPD